jgi:hypothetical protein
MIYINSPTGGFGNHLAWLIWSNSEFSSILLKNNINENHYNKIKGVSWPNYKDLSLCNIESESLLLEFQSYGLIDNLIKNPVDFLINNVYNNRSWHDWLKKEWEFRNRLKNIVVGHTHKIKINPDHFYIFGKASADTCYKHYLKINSSFNNNGIDEFLNDANIFNQNVDDYKNLNNVLIVNNDLLLSDILNNDYYEKIIKFLNLNNDYNNANTLHKKWNFLVKHSEIEFVKEVNRLYASTK